MRTFISRFRVRSYELDSYAHLNHAVYLNYYEQARFDAFEEGGFPPRELERHGWGIHVVRIEVEYRRECRMGDEIEITTTVPEFRRTSFMVHQTACRPGDGERVSEARILAVWIGPDGKPARIPEEARRALT